MLRMLRFRRYRVFLVFTIIASLLLLRYYKNWDQFVPGDTGSGQSPIQKSNGDSTHHLEAPNGHVKEIKEKPAAGQLKTSSANIKATKTPRPNLSSTQEALAVIQTVPHVVLPDRTRPDPKVYEDEEAAEEIHPIGQPGRQELPSFSAVPTTIHWEKQIEHFPVPTESLIQLPTGTPASIPMIQHVFNDETPDAKINREKRQNKVREEFQKAWDGYKKYAWLHDELSPVTGKFRDPFCGWAATLVDSLDTLWMMGLQEEFEEAARAVDLIDFTTSPRADIPVFETTIRYLGGLLAAYDVSGGIYKNLLDKAVELADILMGAFDTPNRMPVLFYRWKPTFASQPHRAGQRSNLAELGSLSMEFTRLAQLTKDSRYYDAVARVTNALSEFQDSGTKLDGVFPDNVDASGCNRTVPLTEHKTLASVEGGPISPASNADPSMGFKNSMPETVAEPIPNKKKIKSQGPADLEVQIAPGTPAKAEILGWDDNQPSKAGRSKRELDNSTISNTTKIQDQTLIAKDAGVPLPKLPSRSPPNIAKDPITGLPIDMHRAKDALGSDLGNWDCTLQGLVPSRSGQNKFSMGGGQDSTYEYFPKQYLLLGGREEKYHKMYLKTIDAVRKWMIYRPMIPGSRDILFSGSVTTYGHPETDLTLTAEVTHLTCFIGGMVGMGAKLFGLEGDLEIAMKLTDGCVWAYESMPSGIMPESSTVLPCVSAEQCPWNETAYWEFLDPMGASRDASVAKYIENKEIEEEAEKQKMSEAAELTTDEEMIYAQRAAANVPHDKQKQDIAEYDEKTRLNALADHTHPTNTAPTPDSVSLQRRQSSRREEVAEEKVYVDKTLATEAELRQMPSGRQAEMPLTEHTSTAGADFPDPYRPLSHKEFVEARIKQESLPPGFTSIQGKKYILRPEAIESVWYMYRITGDSSWQDKGWKMFESIIKHTSTEYGHSAIRDVTSKEPSQIDEMESFWLAETLKYFFLLYSTPDTISLDEWVLNTEAHPFKREV